MNIQSISIVPEDVGCDASCKYCIACMTPEIKEGTQPIIEKHLSNALQYAIAGHAQTAILTSKGETLASDFNYLSRLLELAKNHGFGQRDLHSNMLRVAKSGKKQSEFLEQLVQPAHGLTNVTMTVASLDPERNTDLMGKAAGVDYEKFVRFLKDNHLVVRFSCVMNKEGVHDRKTIEEYLQRAADIGVDHVVLRGLWVPENAKENEVYTWCRENMVEVHVANKTVEEIVRQNKAIKMYDLPWGQTAYEIINGVGVTGATCTVNAFTSGETWLKSVVFLPDNYLYPNWTAQKPIM